MKKPEKDKRIIAGILIILCFLTGCEFQDSRLEQLWTTVSQYVNSEEGNQLAEELKAHKQQVESNEIVDESSYEKVAKTAADGKEREEEQEAAGEEEDKAQEPENQAFQGRFYYSLLSDSMKVVYGEVYESIISKKEVEVSTLSTENLDIAFQCVLNDFPEIFYVSSYHFVEHTRATETVKLVFSADYEMTEEEIANAQVQIDSYVQTCFAGMSAGMSQYEQVKYVYDYLITNTEYDLNAPNNQNICSVFIGRKSVCQGYAEATEYLLQKLGFTVSVVNGYVGSGNRHAWNILLVDGNYYYMDTTWGDVDYQSAEGTDTGIAKEVMPINYDYFLITTEELRVTHEINNTVPLPACVATGNNYYRKEGLYFEAVDKEKLAQVFQGAKDKGQKAVTIKCSDNAVYEAMRAYLLDEQGIFQYTDNKSSVTYYDSSQMRTLCFWME